MSNTETASRKNNDMCKVFVGNLPFNANNQTLAAYFSAAGNVASANVITRGRRSLGYGFVTFSSEDEANKAQQAFNGKQFEDREINVEFATPRPATDSPASVGTQTMDDSDAQAGGRTRRVRRGTRPARLSGDRKEGPPSATSLFVANLPYTIDDKSLLKLFDGFDVVNAHIVTSKFGRSKGYGFVQFASETEQQRALKELSNSVLDDRPLTVRAAYEQSPQAAETSA